MKLQWKNYKRTAYFRVEVSIYEMKILMGHVNNILETAREKFNDLEDKLVETIQTEIHREKSWKVNGRF